MEVMFGKLILNTWAKLGFVFTALIASLVLYYDSNLSEPKSWFWLHFGLLLLHQFEEYEYPGGFKKFFLEVIWKKEKIIKYPLNDLSIILINVVFGWTAYLYSAISNIQSIELAYGLIGITILNGLMHTILAVKHRRYNPGLVSGFFLMIPFGSLFFVKIFPGFESESVIYGILLFLIAVSLIPFSIYITNQLSSRK